MKDFKDVPGYEGYYQVNPEGKIKSLKRRGTKEKILNPFVSHNGYYKVTLCKNGIKKDKFVHVLVAMAFVFNPDPVNRIYVNHKDRNRLNPAASNLEWVTHHDNILYIQKDLNTEEINFYEKEYLKTKYQEVI